MDGADSSNHALTVEAIRRDLMDSFDEELEMELEEERLEHLALGHVRAEGEPAMDRRTYFRELLRLQHELVRLQSWVQAERLRVVVVFEGRDSAGNPSAPRLRMNRPTRSAHKRALIVLGGSLCVRCYSGKVIEPRYQKTTALTRMKYD